MEQGQFRLKLSGFALPWLLCGHGMGIVDGTGRADAASAAAGGADAAMGVAVGEAPSASPQPRPSVQSVRKAAQSGDIWSWGLLACRLLGVLHRVAGPAARRVGDWAGAGAGGNGRAADGSSAGGGGRLGGAEDLGCGALTLQQLMRQAEAQAVAVGEWPSLWHALSLADGGLQSALSPAFQVTWLLPAHRTH